MKVKLMASVVLCCISFAVFSQQTIDPTDAYKHVGDTVTVCGKIFTGRYLETANKQPTLLNMGDKYPKQPVTIVIYADTRKKMGYRPEEVLIDKQICVTGKVELFHDKPQIIITDQRNMKIF